MTALTMFLRGCSRLDRVSSLVSSCASGRFERYGGVCPPNYRRKAVQTLRISEARSILPIILPIIGAAVGQVFGRAGPKMSVPVAGYLSTGSRELVRDPPDLLPCSCPW